MNSIKNRMSDLFDEAIKLHQQGDLERAELLYRSILVGDKHNARVLYLLSLIVLRRGDVSSAVQMLSQAINIEPSQTEFLCARANIYSTLREWELAEQDYLAVIKLNPTNPNSYYNYGVFFQLKGNLIDALEQYKKVIRLANTHPDANLNIALIFESLQHYEDAIDAAERILQTNPAAENALLIKANAFARLGKFENSYDIYRSLIDRGVNKADIFYNFANVCKEMGRVDEAKYNFKQALRIDPEHSFSQFGLAFVDLAAITKTTAEIDLVRTNLNKALMKLAQYCDDVDSESIWEAVGAHQPFYLAYHDRDNLHLLSRHGQICCKAMSRLADTLNAKFPNSSDRKSRVRVGFLVANQKKNYSVWNAITKGFLRNIDSHEFETHILNIGSADDTEVIAMSNFVSSVTHSIGSVQGWISKIQEKNLDILVVPEIGMDQTMLQLASLRLAPVQIATWGHPETTGLPTIDYYLSAELFEPADAQAYYSEKLVKLPNLGTCVSSTVKDIADINPAQYGLNTSLPIFVCGGALQKYSPDFDDALVSIASRLEKCQFVFFRSSVPKEQALRQRLKNKFELNGLVLSEFVFFLPWLPPREFHGLLGKSSAFLDSFGFSGFNTVLQAIDCELPVITKRGRFMRGRFGVAILERIRLEELVAETDLEFVKKAIDVATNKLYRTDLQLAIASRKTLLFDDMAPVRAIEKFFRSVSPEPNKPITV